jgi:exodeoxyribonuclease-3
MKIVTWNCGRGFAKKAEHIFSGSPDIAVIQECSKKSTEMFVADGYIGHWAGGDNPNIGMGVFHTADWSLRKLAESTESDPRWITPFEVAGPIAVWACAEWQNRMRVEIGSHDDWASESDHCPVTVDVSLL